MSGGKPRTWRVGGRYPAAVFIEQQNALRRNVRPHTFAQGDVILALQPEHELIAHYPIELAQQDSWKQAENGSSVRFDVRQ